MGKLFGLTHDEGSGALTGKVSRMLKVSIGLPKGKDAHVFIAPDGKWVIKCGELESRVDDIETAKKHYARALQKAPDRKFPKKLPYFTFTRDAGTGQVADLDAIGAHGPSPTSIDVVLFGDRVEDAVDQKFAMWGKSEMQCSGDGVNAERSVKLAKTQAERDAANGGKYFPIVGQCFASGKCTYCQGETPACKPSFKLSMQLVKYPVVGGVAQFATTGKKTIKTLGPSLERMFEELGTVDGTCVTLSLRPYNTKSGQAYYLSVAQVHAIRNLQIAKPVIEEKPEAEQAADFNAEFVSAGEPEVMTIEDLSPDQIRELREHKQVANAAKLATFLAQFPRGTEFAVIREAL